MVKTALEIFEKADVVNFGAVLALLVWALLVGFGLYLATLQSDSWAAYKDVCLWAAPVLLGILSTYGIIKQEKAK